MKKLFFLFALAVLAACSDNKPQEETQDYTSFVFYTPEDLTFPNCVAGYFDDEGYCWKIADLGDLSKDEYSSEVIVFEKYITEIYLFSDYFGVRMFNEPYTLKINTKNIFKIEGQASQVDKTDHKSYPQEREAK